MTTNEINDLRIRAYADWQLFSEASGDQWMANALTRAKDAGIITDFEIVRVAPGAFGLQFIIFSVDLDVPRLPYDELRGYITDLLNRKVVHDDDVSVRWFVARALAGTNAD